MRTWLYRGTRAELIKVVLWRMSVGGVVARICHFTAFKSIFWVVSQMVSSMVLASSMPRCLMLSGVVKPLCCRSWIREGAKLMQRAEDFLTLMLSPLTPVYQS